MHCRPCAHQNLSTLCTKFFVGFMHQKNCRPYAPISFVDFLHLEDLAILCTLITSQFYHSTRFQRLLHAFWLTFGWKNFNKLNQGWPSNRPKNQNKYRKIEWRWPMFVSKKISPTNRFWVINENLKNRLTRPAQNLKTMCSWWKYLHKAPTQFLKILKGYIST